MQRQRERAGYRRRERDPDWDHPTDAGTMRRSDGPVGLPEDSAVAFRTLQRKHVNESGTPRKKTRSRSPKIGVSFTGLRVFVFIHISERKCAQRPSLNYSCRRVVTSLDSLND